MFWKKRKRWLRYSCKHRYWYKIKYNNLTKFNLTILWNQLLQSYTVKSYNIAKSDLIITWNQILQSYKINSYNPINQFSWCYKIVFHNRVKLNDIILDFHEGWGYIRQNNKSVGSSITCSKIPIKYQNDIIKKINSSITEDYKLWSINTQKTEIMHSLRDYAIDNKKAYMLIETSGQNNIQPLDIRVSQNITIITYILKKYRIL